MIQNKKLQKVEVAAARDEVKDEFRFYTALPMDIRNHMLSFVAKPYLPLKLEYMTQFYCPRIDIIRKNGAFNVTYNKNYKGPLPKGVDAMHCTEDEVVDIMTRECEFYVANGHVWRLFTRGLIWTNEDGKDDYLTFDGNLGRADVLQVYDSLLRRLEAIMIASRDPFEVHMEAEMSADYDEYLRGEEEDLEQNVEQEQHDADEESSMEDSRALISLIIDEQQASARWLEEEEDDMKGHIETAEADVPRDKFGLRIQMPEFFNVLPDVIRKKALGFIQKEYATLNFTLDSEDESKVLDISIKKHGDGYRVHFHDTDPFPIIPVVEVVPKKDVVATIDDINTLVLLMQLKTRGDIYSIYGLFWNWSIGEIGLGGGFWDTAEPSDGKDFDIRKCLYTYLPLLGKIYK
jgi:hypothetical protein